MRQKSSQPPPSYPVCSLCRDGTPATQTFPFPGAEKDSSYCNVCGTAMLSVLKDAGHPTPKVHRLPSVKAENISPKVEAPKVETSKPVMSPKPVVAPTPKPPQGHRSSVLQAAQDFEDCDILSLLGCKP